MAPFRSVTKTAAHGTKRKIRPIVAHSFLCCGRPAPRTKTNNMAPILPKRARRRLKTAEDEEDEEGGEGADELCPPQPFWPEARSSIIISRT